ncbi:MAG: RluA family pseudouridine synthase [bacterium]
MHNLTTFMNIIPVTPDGKGKRLDAWLSLVEPDLSRARIQDLIRTGHITLNGKPAKPSQTLVTGQEIQIDIPPPVEVDLKPEAIPLDVLFEDADLIVINKPAGLVVHPAAGHASGTLVNALLAHCPDLAGIGGEKRPGIVHRLDRDTTGVMVVAKNDIAMRALSSQFKHRQTTKEYLALVWGHLTPPSGRAETLIGRNPHDRKKMCTKPDIGRPAITNYETREKFADTSLLRVSIETGRTHQIRVHMAHLGHSIVGDPQYGRPRRDTLPVPVPARQMLHAASLTFTHPATGQVLTFEAPLPEDMGELLAVLRR